LEAVARGLNPIRESERARQIPEGINAVTVMAFQPAVEYQQRSRRKNHERKQNV
jgi:hypothetical protein